LQERLNRIQTLAVGLATLGVSYFIWQFGAIPWAGLGIGFSFAIYALLRKLIIVEAILGLALETLVLSPIALGLLLYWQGQGVGHFGHSRWLTILFINAGIVTSLPLICFNLAAKRLRLTTLGFLQYLNPTLQLSLGVFLYSEPFTATHLVTFTLIWIALGIYSVDTLLRQTHQWQKPVRSS
jgi:chloramphenicol-sensitive protein RarD